MTLYVRNAAAGPHAGSEGFFGSCAARGLAGVCVPILLAFWLAGCWPQASAVTPPQPTPKDPNIGRVTDSEVLSASYDEAYQAIDKDGSLIEAGIQAQLADLAKTDPRAKTAHPSDFFDASIINELYKEGFVKALWASK